MGSSDTPVRVFLVDDHEVVRRGVAEVLEEDPVISVVGEAGSVAEALARVPAVRPDVTVVDMRLPDGDGAEVVFTLRRRPGTTDEVWAADIAAVSADLDTLRRVLESR